MSGRFGMPRSQALTLKGGALAAAAATFVAGAGGQGVAQAGPEISAPAAWVHHDVALTDYPTFTESLQTLLDDLGVGNLNQVLGGFGAYTIDSSVALFLAGLNPNGDTLNGVAEIFGISLTDPLYSTTVDSLLGQGSLFLLDGVPIGYLDLGGTDGIIDVLLGEGAGSHSLTALANAVGLGSMLSQYASLINALGLENMNVQYCTLGCSTFGTIISNPDLNVNSSLNDWLSGILGKPTVDITQHAFSGLGATTVVPNSAWTLGQYLQSLPVSATDPTTMANATLGLLFGLPPNQPWDQYVSNFPFGGTLLDPSGETWGEQTLGTLLGSFLLDDSTLTITGDTPITDFLVALGLLTP
ncbi:hypothetical protein [Mycolicibacter longobardus]|uniref:PE-PGRS family protein n=1 Tax=Mycolicibacter longobardus TaxID=1108812 RepID=A0A1X1Y747_9MYCO|nr:hypothetical protein [Mycolicibacter longobardus]ORW06953.1 hypothetical protein AWC16_22130 [Mycolicibacter longobardus]